MHLIEHAGRVVRKEVPPDTAPPSIISGETAMRAARWLVEIDLPAWVEVEALMLGGKAHAKSIELTLFDTVAGFAAEGYQIVKLREIQRKCHVLGEAVNRQALQDAAETLDCDWWHADGCDNRGRANRWVLNPLVAVRFGGRAAEAQAHIAAMMARIDDAAERRRRGVK